MFFWACLHYQHQYIGAQPRLQGCMETSANLKLPCRPGICLMLSSFLHFFYSDAERHVRACRHILFQVAAGLKALPPPGPGRPEDSSQMGSDNASAATQLDKVSTPLLRHVNSVCIACLHIPQRAALPSTMPAPPCSFQTACCRTRDWQSLSGLLQQQLDGCLAVYQPGSASAW